MASAQSLLGLVSQLQNMEISFTSILMEGALKLGALTDANIFILVETPEGRRFCGKRHLCDFYASGALTPTGNDVEVEVDTSVTSLHEVRRRGHGPSAGAGLPPQNEICEVPHFDPLTSRNFDPLTSKNFEPLTNRNQNQEMTSPKNRKRGATSTWSGSASKKARAAGGGGGRGGAAGVVVMVKGETDWISEEKDLLKETKFPSSEAGNFGVSLAQNENVDNPLPSYQLESESSASSVVFDGESHPFDPKKASAAESEARNVLVPYADAGPGEVKEKLMGGLPDIPSDKLMALQCIPPEDALTKGSVGFKLLNSILYDLGKRIAHICCRKGYLNSKDPLAKAEFSTYFDTWINENLRHLMEHGLKIFDGNQNRSALGFMKYITRTNFNCTMKGFVSVKRLTF